MWRQSSFNVSLGHVIYAAVYYAILLAYSTTASETSLLPSTTAKTVSRCPRRYTWHLSIYMVIWETLRRYERITTSDKAWEAFILMLRISAQTFVKETGDSDLSSSDRTDENITLSSVLMISPSCWQHLSLLQVPSTSAHNDHQIFGSGCLSCGNMYCFFVLAISRGMVQVEQHGSRTFVCQQASTTALFFNGEN